MGVVGRVSRMKQNNIHKDGGGRTSNFIMRCWSSRSSRSPIPAPVWPSKVATKSNWRHTPQACGLAGLGELTMQGAGIDRNQDLPRRHLSSCAEDGVTPYPTTPTTNLISS